jgi:hypothetical protein
VDTWKSDFVEPVAWVLRGKKMTLARVSYRHATLLAALPCPWPQALMSFTLRVNDEPA